MNAIYVNKVNGLFYKVHDGFVLCRQKEDSLWLSSSYSIKEFEESMKADAWKWVYVSKYFDEETEEVTAQGIVKAAAGHMEDRADTYDSPEGERSMEKTVEAFNIIFDKDLTEEEGWMFMCLLKIVRSNQGVFKLDNYEDLSAYAALAGESAFKERP